MKFKSIIELRKTLLYKLISILCGKRFGWVVFDIENPPLVGDSISVGNLRATFEQVPLQKEAE